MTSFLRQVILPLFPSSSEIAIWPGSLTVGDYRFFIVRAFHDSFLGKSTEVVCHCLPLVLPAVPVRSPPCRGLLTVRTTRRWVRRSLVNQPRSVPCLRPRTSVGSPSCFTSLEVID